jgi:hypothetical protein
MRANTRKPIPRKLKEEAPPKRGRPPKVVTLEIVQSHRNDYNEAVATEILGQLSEGRTLRSICSAPAMPSAHAVRRWAAEDIHGFADRFERARRLGADAIFDEALEISDGEFIDHAEVQGARLRVDTRFRYLAKLFPEKYGDKVEITSKTEKLTDQEVDAQLLNLLETADHASLLKQPARKLLGKPRV